MLRLALLIQSGATGWQRFSVFSVVAFAVFASVLRLALRNRNASPKHDVCSHSAWCKKSVRSPPK